MSANPHKPSAELASETSELASALSRAASPAAAPTREALQALLAFSSLHEQIRQRRARERRNGVSDPNDVWELEQFVLDEVLQLVAERAMAITGADGIAIALAEGEAIVCRASAGTIAPDAGAHLDPNSGFSGACLRSGRIIRCDDVENDPRVNVQACRRLGTRSMVAVPLAGQRSVIGLLEAFSSEAYSFNDSDVRSLSLLAELILAAMKPEEEDRLAEISRRLVPAESGEAAQHVAVSDPERLNPYAESPADASAERITSTNSETDISKPDTEPAIFSQVGASEKSRPGLGVVLLVLLIALALAGGLWWKLRHQNQSPPASPPQAASATMVQTKPSPSMEEDSATSRANFSDPASDENPGGLPRVIGIRHSSSAGSSTVIVDLQDQVQYEAHRLSNPDRIYIDLHETGLAPGLFGKTIEVNEDLLTRVRIAQPVRGVTRVVLETKSASDFSVRLESNPYRLVVEVRSVATNTRPTAPPRTQPQTKMEVVAPVTSPAQKIPAAPTPITSAQPVLQNDRRGPSGLERSRVRHRATFGEPRPNQIRCASDLYPSGRQLRCTGEAG
jgi:hypothetical protein